MSEMNENIDISKFTAGDKFFGQMRDARIADNDFIKEIVEMFLNECSISLKAIKEGFDRRDVQAIQLNAHKLKSSFLMFDMHEAHGLAMELEKLAEPNKSNFEVYLKLNETCEYNFKLLKLKYLNQ